jgi:hypothetical protein
MLSVIVLITFTFTDRNYLSYKESLGATTLNIMAFSITTLSKMTCSTTTLSIMTLAIKAYQRH